MNTKIKKLYNSIQSQIEPSKILEKFSKEMISLNLASGLAIYLFEFEKVFFSNSMNQYKNELLSFDESDFSIFEDTDMLKKGVLIPGTTMLEFFTGSLEDLYADFSFYPIIRDEILHGIFILYKPQIHEDLWEYLFPFLFSTLEGVFLRERENTKHEIADSPDTESLMLRKKAFELDSIAKASMDFTVMKGDDLYKTFIYNVIGVSLCESIAIFTSQNQKNTDYLVKQFKGLNVHEIENLALHDDLYFIKEIRKKKSYVYLAEIPEKDLSYREKILTQKLGLDIAVPMLIKDNIAGILLLGKRINNQPYNKEILESISILLNQLSLTLETRKLTDIKYAFSRYVTTQLIDEVLANPENLNLGGTRQKVTILFADIRNFTSMSEQLEPEEVVSILNTYMTALTEVIFKYEGTIDKYIGDCLMATFGAPLSQFNDSERAVMAAIDMQKTITSLNTLREERGEQKIKIGIGLNTGECILGNMGSVERMDYTVIGDMVNVAARLEQLAKPGQILITEGLFREIRYLITTKEVEPVVLKGKKSKTRIYEVTGLISDKVVNYIETLNPYKDGFYSQVSKDVLLIAEQMGMSKADLKKFSTSIMVYDIGIIKLPKKLWSSADSLSKKEEIELQKHPSYGAEILKKMRFFPEAIAMAKTHHEYWDGSGYPDGLKGKQIPIFARIISVVESFYAMINKRMYKKLLTKSEALEEIKKLSGKKYDPAIVKTFEDIITSVEIPTR